MRTPSSFPVLFVLFSFLAAARASAQAQVPEPNIPEGNPITTAKKLLGKALYWDEQLSSTKSVACGTCHVPSVGSTDPRVLLSTSVHPGLDGMLGTEDDRRGSMGVSGNLASGHYVHVPPFGLNRQVTPRKAPPVINAALFDNKNFWDGRANGEFKDPLTGTVVLPNFASLENQALAPPLSDVEMARFDRGWADVTATIAAAEPLALASNIDPELAAHIADRTYPALFNDAFGTPSVTPVRIAMAIATYERTLISTEPRILGGPPFTDPEILGAQIFDGKGKCIRCHDGGAFTDNGFHNTGVASIEEDPGRWLVTGLSQDLGKFKTPALLNTVENLSWMHDGSITSIQEVIEFYDRGGDHHVNQSDLIKPLGLTELEKQGLVAYLGLFTDARVVAESGPFTRPTLASETIVPEPFGFATAGTGGFLPELRAFEPPVATNTSFTVGVEKGKGGALSWLWIDVPAPPTIWMGRTIFLGMSSQLMILGGNPLQGAGPGGGHISEVVDLTLFPPSLVGIELAAQWIIDDPFAASDAVGFTICD